MNPSKFFYFLIAILIGLFFTGMGIIALFITWSSTIRDHFFSFFLSNSLLFSLIAFILIAIGIAIVTFSILGIRHRYYRIRGGSRQVLVDEALIQDYLDQYWIKIFPENEIPNRLEIKNNKIHVIADLPFVPLDDQKDIIQRVDSDLTKLLESVIGYQQDFLLSISFKNDSTTRKNFSS